VIEYPERMTFYLRQQNHSSGIQSVIVADASRYVVSYITCNKSEQGQQLIKHIDKALMALWQTEAYQQIMFRWIDKADTKALDPAFQSVKQQVINAQ
jgi:uncharacterized protein (TIGR02285 family)